MYDLSIIIPHYNSLSSLKQLLDSIPLSKKIQIIVVDDRSDISLCEVKKEYENIQEKDILFLENLSSKKGAGVCRNIGLDHTLGKWVLFADSDDFFIDDFYQLVEKYFNSNNDIVYFTPTSVDKETGEISDRHLHYKTLISDYLKKKSKANLNFLRFEFYVPWSKLYKKSFLDKHHIKFDEVIASNDLLFSTKTGFYMADFEVCDKPIYCVTKSKGSLTTKINKEVYLSRVKAYIRYIHFLENRLSPEEFKSMGINGRHLLVNGIQQKVGMFTFYKAFIYLVRGRVELFDFKLLNPLLVLKRLNHYITVFKTDKEYHDK